MSKLDAMKLKIIEISYHRNGVCGEGFYAVLFRWHDSDVTPARERRMVASVFDTPGQCAVYDVDELARENVRFAQGNSWRGDHFELALRRAIKKAWLNRIGPFALPQSQPQPQKRK